MSSQRPCLGAQVLACKSWRVKPFEPFDEATGFGGGEGFVERRRRMRIQIVLNQNDFVRGGTMRVGQVVERMRAIDGGATVGDFHAPPAFQRREPAFQRREHDQ